MSTNSSPFRDGLFFKAVAISCCLNCAMIVLGTIGGTVKSLSVLAWISGVLAMPTGFILGWLIRPTTHTVGAVVVASLEGLFGSIVIYTVLAWAVLRFAVRRTASKAGEDQA